MADKMKAVRLYADWDPKPDFRLGPKDIDKRQTYLGSKVWRNPRLTIEDVPVPKPGPGEVVLEVKQVGTNKRPQHARRERDGGRPRGGQDEPTQRRRGRRDEGLQRDAFPRHRHGEVVAKGHVENHCYPERQKRRRRLENETSDLVASQCGRDEAPAQIHSDDCVGLALHGSGQQAVQPENLRRMVLDDLGLLDARDRNVDGPPQKNAEGNQQRARGPEAKFGQCRQKHVGQEEREEQEQPQEKQRQAASRGGAHE